MLFLGPDMYWAWLICFAFADDGVRVLKSAVACVSLVSIFRSVSFHKACTCILRDAVSVTTVK